MAGQGLSNKQPTIPTLKSLQQYSTTALQHCTHVLSDHTAALARGMHSSAAKQPPNTHGCSSLPPQPPQHHNKAPSRWRHSAPHTPPAPSADTCQLWTGTCSVHRQSPVLEWWGRLHPGAPPTQLTHTPCPDPIRYGHAAQQPRCASNVPAAHLTALIVTGRTPTRTLPVTCNAPVTAATPPRN